MVYEKKVKLKNYLTTLSGKTSYMGDDVLYIPTEPEGYYEIEVTSFDSKNTKLTAMTGCFVSAGKMSWWSVMRVLSMFSPKRIHTSPVILR